MVLKWLLLELNGIEILCSVQRNFQNVAIWNQKEQRLEADQRTSAGEVFSPSLNVWMFLFTELHGGRSARSQARKLLCRTITEEYRKGII